MMECMQCGPVQEGNGSDRYTAYTPSMPQFSKGAIEDCC